MAPQKKRGSGQKRPFIDTLQDELVAAVTERKDFILCFETNDDTGADRIHVMTGKFVTSCMLRKLIGQAESQQDEGNSMISKKWP